MRIGRIMRISTFFNAECFIVTAIAVFILRHVYLSLTRPIPTSNTHVRSTPVKSSVQQVQDGLRGKPFNSLPFEQFKNTSFDYVLRPNYVIPMTFPKLKNASIDYKHKMAELNRNQVNMDDPELLLLVWKYYIVPPSMKPYNLKYMEQLGNFNDTIAFIDKMVNHTKGGVFIEYAALDGEKGSQTLFFETERNWNGLLIEPDPRMYAMLKSKNRKAFTINACLNTQPYPANPKELKENEYRLVTVWKHIVHVRELRQVKQIMFKRHLKQSSMEQEEESVAKNIHLKENYIEAQCFPIYSLLKAMNKTTVDLFSLGVDGDELSVLKTIPWELVNIKMIAVEFVLGNAYKGLVLSYYLELKGYRVLKKFHIFGANDAVLYLFTLH